MALFDDKVAVITGAARGLGRDYASFFAGDGARVVIADIDGAGAEKAAADLIAETHHCVRGCGGHHRRGERRQRRPSDHARISGASTSS